MPPQSIVLDGQPHPPLAQPIPPVHTMPQPPQLLVLFEVLTQDPLQSVVPAGHETVHLLMLHTWVEVQAVPHMPQLAGSLVVFTHTPLQFVVPGGHPQTPPEHAKPAAQAFPQPPQLLGSV